VEVARLGHGQSFGELSLVLEQPRAATVTALEPTDLLALSKTSYDAIIKEVELERMNELNTVMKSVACFGLVDRSLITMLIPWFKEIKYILEWNGYRQKCLLFIY
jgi:hypothetical protein